MTWQAPIAVAGVPPQPWRNGGGSTRELFTWPATGPWQLRISVADITQDGPFSAFPGVDRWFAVLQGVGVQLTLPGQAALALTPASPPLAFAGEAAPACQLRAGDTRDLNLMVQRAAGQGAMLSAEPSQPWLSDAPLRGLFSTADVALQADGGPGRPVAAWSLQLCPAAAGQRWQIGPLPAGGRACWLAFTPHPATA